MKMNEALKNTLLGPLSKNNPIAVQVLGICSALAVTVELKPALAYASLYNWW
jgi:Na+-transporting NADH:ubiquinone oxidoreductase subunit D